MFNSNFYPTPKKLSARMIRKVRWEGVTYVLDPEAGKGDLLDAVKEHGKYRGLRLHAVEIEPDLQSILRDKGYSLVGQDFLDQAAHHYSYDLIIMNPPFDAGAEHLLKAIEILYSGQIVCILNAETIRNPHSNVRKLLLRRLEELEAEIEYLQDTFKGKGVERKTAVEVALVYIRIERDVEEDLLGGASDQVKEFTENVVEDDQELVTSHKIRALVQEYENARELGIKTIIDYYKNYRKIGAYIYLKNSSTARKNNDYSHDDEEDMAQADLNERVKTNVNLFLYDIRDAYWKKVLKLDAVTRRLTKKRTDEIQTLFQQQRKMEVTEKNILSVISGLINSYEPTMNAAVVELFDKLSAKYAWHEELHNKNVHYFNGWKTNSAFRVNKKVIFPVHVSEFYGGIYPSLSGNGLIGMAWEQRESLNDIDKVMNFFAGLRSYKSIADVITEAKWGAARKLESTFFIVDFYKKGTIHLTFRDLDILRKFNYVAAREKAWLPQDYGTKKYEDCSTEEKAVVDEFEGEESYSKFVFQGAFAVQQVNLIEER